MRMIILLPSILLLGACARTTTETRSYGNDALPSAEMTAFQKADARLHYRDARIEYGADSCAVYQGTAPDGQVRREPLLDRQGQPICVKR